MQLLVSNKPDKLQEMGLFLLGSELDLYFYLLSNSLYNFCAGALLKLNIYFCFDLYFTYLK